MNNPLRTPEDYELFIYTISERYAEIIHSKVAFIHLGATLARAAGEIQFEEGYRLIIRERIIFSRLPVVIDGYGYEVWQDAEKLYWYDSQPHPDDAVLQKTAPHHKHVPPDIKHHRIPAPEMSFIVPNLPTIIAEIIELIKAAKSQTQSK
jgi:hypothetical protein